MAVSNRVLRFLSTDEGIISLLAAIILLLAIGGVELSRFIAARMLCADAESTSSAWAGTLLDSADDIPSVAAGASPSDHTAHLLQEASQVGDIYRYRIWNHAGQLVLTSERKTASRPVETIAERYGQQKAASIFSGQAFTQSVEGTPPDDPTSYAVSCIPIKKNDAVVGILEVYLDQSADRSFYEKSFLITESIIAIAVLLAGGIPVFMVYHRMAAHRAAQAEALFLAEHDSLTGLPNRKRLAEAAKNALAWSRRHSTRVAAILLDVDRLTDINDTFGHAAGDELLRGFAVRIQSTVRDADVVARLGGDEFLILQVGMEQPAGAAHLAERLLNNLARPFPVDGSELACRASIGVAVAPTDAEEWEKLLSCADAALHKSKSAGRNTVSFFEPGMDANIRKRWQLETDLRRALETTAFQLAYQPFYDLRSNTLEGFEALLRWPAGWEPKSPAEFVPLAEDCGLIVPIGSWVLETACRAAASWAKPVKVAVNLSPVQFRHHGIVGTVKEALQKSGLDPRLLELEVTESLWIQNSDTVLGQLEQLRAMGISIALDDFGTGYSSLSYLWKFPFDKVKIDRSFVTGIQADAKASAIVSTIVAMGRTLNLTVIAEGVETPEEASAIRNADCDQAQGYLFGRPLSPAVAAELVNTELGSSESGAPDLGAADFGAIIQ